MKPSGYLKPGLLITAALLVFSFPINLAFAVNSLPSGITLFTTEKMYTAGQTVRILGQIHSYSGGSPMLMTVYSPEQKAVLSNTISSAGQIVEFTFPLDKGEIREGTWRVVVIYADLRAETTFSLMNKYSFHQAILGKPVLKDNMGNPPTPERQRAGHAMEISAEVENDQDMLLQFAFITQVLDQNKISVYASFVTGTIGPSQTTTPAVNWTPKASGIYNVEVFIWNSLGAPIPLADKQTNTFEILA